MYVILHYWTYSILFVSFMCHMLDDRQGLFSPWLGPGYLCHSCQVIKNLTGHMIGPYKIHAEKWGSPGHGRDLGSEGCVSVVIVASSSAFRFWMVSDWLKNENMMFQWRMPFISTRCWVLDLPSRFAFEAFVHFYHLFLGELTVGEEYCQQTCLQPLARAHCTSPLKTL